MTISSRTPEGQPKPCPVCGKEPIVDPSTYPTRDAPCPHCGSLLLYAGPTDSSTKTAPTPEPELKNCPVCGKELIVDPSIAPCARCGSLVPLDSPADGSTRNGAVPVPESPWPWMPLPPRAGAPSLQVRELADAQDIEAIEHLLERLEK
jgi:DNA-directed RNA polymerase subunit RPC12/RpoP